MINDQVITVIRPENHQGVDNKKRSNVTVTIIILPLAITTVLHHRVARFAFLNDRFLCALQDRNYFSCKTLKRRRRPVVCVQIKKLSHGYFGAFIFLAVCLSLIATRRSGCCVNFYMNEMLGGRAAEEKQKTTTESPPPSQLFIRPTNQDQLK